MTFGRDPVGRNKRKRRKKTKSPMKMCFFEKTRRLGEGDLEPLFRLPLLKRGRSVFFLRKYPSLIVSLSGVLHHERPLDDVSFKRKGGRAANGQITCAANRSSYWLPKS